MAREGDVRERIVCENEAFAVVVPFWAVWPFETLHREPPSRAESRFARGSGARRARRHSAAALPAIRRAVRGAVSLLDGLPSGADERRAAGRVASARARLPAAPAVGDHSQVHRRLRAPGIAAARFDAGTGGRAAAAGRAVIARRTRAGDVQVTATAFAALFSVVGLALYGLPLYYDFMVRDFGWSRTMVTSGNALSKLLVGPLFGFGAGWIVDRFGPRRLMLAGILMAGGALVGLGATSAVWAFYLLLSTERDRVRVRRAAAESGAALAMVRSCARQGDGHRLSRHRDRRRARAVSRLLADDAFRLARIAADRRRADRRDRLSARVLRERHPAGRRGVGADVGAELARPDASRLTTVRDVMATPSFYLLAIGSMCSIAAVGGANQHLKLLLSLDRGYSQARRRADHLARPDRQHRRPPDDGMARRSPADEVRDAADLSARRRFHAVPAHRRIRDRPCTSSRSCSVSVSAANI